MATHHRRIRIWAVVVLVLIVVVVLVVTLSADTSAFPPRSRVLRFVRRPLGLGPGSGRNALTHPDVLSNVLLFIPVGLAGALAFPRHKLVVLAAAALTSIIVEVTQGVFLPDRTASARDVASNVAGALIGLAIVAAIVAATRAIARRGDGAGRGP